MESNIRDPRWRGKRRHVISQPSKMVSFCRANETLSNQRNFILYHALTERKLGVHPLLGHELACTSEG